MDASALSLAPTFAGLGSLPNDLKRAVVSHLPLKETYALLQVPGWRAHALDVLLATCIDLEPYTDLLFPACRRRGDVMDRTIDTSARTVATAHIYGGYARRLDFKEHRAEPETRRATYYLLQRSSDYLPLRPREWFPNLFEADLIISSRYGTAAFLALPHHLTSLKVTFGRDLSLAGLATIEQFAQLQELVVTTMERAPLTLAPFLKMARTLRVLRIRHVYPVFFDKTTLEKLLRRFRALRTLEITPRAPECPVGGVSAVALDCLAAVHDTQHVALEEFAAYFSPDGVPQSVGAYASRTAEVTLLDLGMDIGVGVAGHHDIARYARSLFPDARLEGGYPVSALL